MSSCDDLSIERVTPGDHGSIRSFLDALDEHSRRQLSVGAGPRLRTTASGAALAVRAGHADCMARTAEGTVVGAAEWRRTRHGGELAELSVVVAAACRRRGVATALLRALAIDAIEAGVGTWFMTTLSGNRPALDLMRGTAQGAHLHREGVLTTVLAPVRALLPADGPPHEA